LGIVDLALKTEDATGHERTLLVECKVEADIGARSGAPVNGFEEHETSHALADWTQIDNYLRHAESAGYYLAVITKYPVLEQEAWSSSKAWLGIYKWLAVDRELRACKAEEGESYAFLADQTHQFFVEHGMAFDRIGPELKPGTLYRQQLWQMLVEAATTAARGHGLTVRRGHDQWSVYAEWRNGTGVVIGGIAYSDTHGDMGIWMDGDWHNQLADPSLLEKQEALANARGPKTDRFWGLFYVPVELDDTFFSADADGQLIILADRGAKVLEAFVAVGGTG
jgi:hypothetical protein